MMSQLSIERRGGAAQNGNKNRLQPPFKQAIQTKVSILPTNFMPKVDFPSWDQKHPKTISRLQMVGEPPSKIKLCHLTL